MCKVGLLGIAGLAAALGVAIAGCGSSTISSEPSPEVNIIRAVGAESQYANVIAQIGGRYVSVVGIMSNPNIDPHTYEANTQDAVTVAKATLVVQNGVGYDSFMNKLESASPNSKRIVIDVGSALGYGPDVKNPHFWYNPKTMPVVARLVTQALIRQMPSHRRYFDLRLTTFDHSLGPWHQALTQLKSAYAGTAVAVTEPVADYMLQAAGLDVKTPWAFQAAIMNGTDPSPQDVQIEEGLLEHHRVKVFVYNQQAVDSTTEALLGMAKTYHVPVVGVYETMPAHYTYQKWMTAEVDAVESALKDGKSTVTMR